MDPNEQIQKRISDLVLNGNSLKPNKKEFVLTHVYGFIAQERNDMVKEIRKQAKKAKEQKAKEQKAKEQKAKEQTAKEQKATAKEQKAKEQKNTKKEAVPLASANKRVEIPSSPESKNNPEEKRKLNKEKARKNAEKHIAKMLQLKKTERVFIYAEAAVDDWNKYSADLITLINEGRGQEILTAVKGTLNLASVCVESAVFCLSLLVKKSQVNIEERDEKFGELSSELDMEKDQIKQLIKDLKAGKSKPDDVTLEDWNIIKELRKIQEVKQQFLRLVSDCYTSVSEICKTTSLLMLFIEICKIFNYSKKKFTGFGRGLKTAILKWYLNWKPEDLALEVTRHRGAYTWSHKNVLIEAHISLKKLPLDYAVVFHYVFTGYHITKEKYSTQEKYKEQQVVKDILRILDVWNENAEEMEDVAAIVGRGGRVVQEFTSVTLNDFRSQVYKHNEVMAFFLNTNNSKLIIDALLRTCLFRSVNANDNLAQLLIDNLKSHNFSQEVDLLNVLLAYNYTRRISSEVVRRIDNPENVLGKKKRKWMKKADPDSNRHEKQKNIIGRSTKINEIFKLLSDIITDGTRDLHLNFQNIPVICIEFDPTMICLYVGAFPANFVSKQLRSTQVVAYLLLAFGAHINLGNLLPQYKNITDKFNHPGVHLDFSTLISALNNEVKKGTTASVSEYLKIAREKKAKTALLIYPKISKETIEQVSENLTTSKATNVAKPQFRVILFGLEGPEFSEIPDGFNREDVLLLYGFNRYTLPTIQDFINKTLNE